MRRHLQLATAALAAALASLGLFAAAALADGSGAVAPATAIQTATTAKAPSVPTKTTRPRKAAPTPTAHAVKGKATLSVYDSFVVHHQSVDVPGRVMHVTGVVRPYVAGQTVTVKSYLGKRLFKTDTLRLKPNKSRRAGVFVEKLIAPHAGIVHVEVVHARTPQMVGFIARRGVNALAASTSSPLFVALVQQRLEALHFYLPATGVWDQGTGLAVDAYHRLMGWGTSQTLDPRALTAMLDGEGAFQVRYPGDGKHVEGDLTHQLLALIDGSQVQEIYPISSGKPSTPTILGRFRVYMRTPGYLPDGMYYSDFFYGGYAIHGYDPAPDYPASHGCMRLPITDALSVWNWLTIGVPVDVYYR